MQITKIIVHCSATKPSQNIGVDEIRGWHVDGNGWSDIGYHYVITREGTLQAGRPVSRPGAHAKGHNKNSIGICLVGGIDNEGRPDANFTFSQYRVLVWLISEIKKEHKGVMVIGHRDVSAKACPCFDVNELLESR